MPSPILFNPAHIRRNRARAAANFSAHDFLFRWAGDDLLDRLHDIKREFPRVLIVGERLPEGFQSRLTKQKGGKSVTVSSAQSPEELDLAAGSIDLAISLMDLHTVNDLPGMLQRIRQCLVPDGLFIACLPGGETLHELRSSLMEAELQICSGASPRVAPFADKRQMGSLLQQSGFSLPVVDSDILKVSYRDLSHLMADLRGMGESNAIAARRKTFSPRSLFTTANRLYGEKFPDAGGRIAASFEMIFLIGWAPHESQQRPARPGSAQISLTEVL